MPIHRHLRALRLSALSAHLVAALLIGPMPRPAAAQVPRAATIPVPPTEAEEITRLMQAKDLQGALKRADQFLVKNPRDLQVRFLRAVILSDQNKTADAIAAFEALTQDFPELPEPYNNLAVLHANQGELDLARSLLQQAITAQPNYVTAYENLGDVYVSLAAEAYQRALKIDPNRTTAQSKLTLTREISAKLRAVH
ncbi:MAG TPA: tetratricopeptide repeat protein [Burkholderiaceae bacterium]|nr:tetratricopeptide repeat protein [Burkholderiaceae bacterium]